MQFDSLCEGLGMNTNKALIFLDGITLYAYICIDHLRSGDERRKWCAFVSNFGAQNRPKKMLYIDSQNICSFKNIRPLSCSFTD